MVEASLEMTYKLLEKESEEKRLWRERILRESSAVQPKSGERQDLKLPQKNYDIEPVKKLLDEEESEEKRLWRAKILGESAVVQPKYSREQVMKLLNDCDVTRGEAAKTMEDQQEYLDRLEQKQAELLEKALQELAGWEDNVGARIKGRFRWEENGRPQGD